MERIVRFLNANFQYLVRYILDKFPNYRHFSNCWLLSIYYLFLFRLLVLFPLRNFFFDDWRLTIIILIIQFFLFCFIYFNYRVFIFLYKCALKSISEIYYITLVYWRFVFFYFTGFLHLSYLTGLSISILYLIFGTILPWIIIIVYKIKSFWLILFFFFKFLPNFVTKALSYTELMEGIDLRQLPWVESLEDIQSFYNLPMNKRRFNYRYSLIVLKIIIDYYYGYGSYERTLFKFKIWENASPLVYGRYYSNGKRGLLWKPKNLDKFNFSYEVTLISELAWEYLDIDWSDFFFFWTSDAIFFILFFLLICVY